MAAAGAPPMWNTYLAVNSVDDATAKVEAAGGKVAMAPFDVMDAGRMAFVLDPSGAPVALWQAGRHIGATLVNEPGTINWNELVTTDPGVAVLPDVVGLTTGPWTWAKAGSTRCSRRPGDGRRHDAAADARSAEPLARVLRYRRRGRHRGQGPELGGSVLVPPFDTPVGRMAVLSDPQGAVFSIIKTTPPPA